jgi:hypothetical protein
MTLEIQVLTWERYKNAVYSYTCIEIKVMQDKNSDTCIEHKLVNY